MKTQKLQFALTSLHNSQTKPTSKDINKKTPSTVIIKANKTILI